MLMCLSLNCIYIRIQYTIDTYIKSERSMRFCAKKYELSVDVDDDDMGWKWNKEMKIYTKDPQSLCK